MSNMLEKIRRSAFVRFIDTDGTLDRNRDLTLTLAEVDQALSELGSGWAAHDNGDIARLKEIRAYVAAAPGRSVSFMGEAFIERFAELPEAVVRVLGMADLGGDGNLDPTADEVDDVVREGLEAMRASSTFARLDPAQQAARLAEVDRFITQVRDALADRPPTGVKLR